MDWTTGKNATFAYGRAHGYLVVRGEYEVRLSRFSTEMAAAGLTASVAAAVTRSVIVFPLGRGPGRPAGEPELAALEDTARLYAERFENGTSLDGYPDWQHGQAPEPGAPAMVFLGPGRKRFSCEQCHANVFTRHGAVYTCNGCGERYWQHEQPAPGVFAEDHFAVSAGSLADAFEIAYRPEPDPNAGRCPGPGGCFPGESCDYTDMCSP